jgi:hypothetical protein
MDQIICDFGNEFVDEVEFVKKSVDVVDNPSVTFAEEPTLIDDLELGYVDIQPKFSPKTIGSKISYERIAQWRPISEGHSPNSSNANVMAPIKLKRQISDPITKEERRIAFGVNNECNLDVNSETKSLKFMQFLRQETVRKLRIQRRTGYFRPLLSSVKLFYCTICMENNATSIAFSFEACDENHQFCLPCMKSYTTVQVNDGVTKQGCCFEGCSACAADSEVELLVTPDVYEKYVRFCAVKSDPNYRECSQCNRQLEPTFDESHSHVTNNTLVCGECGNITCFVHGDSHPSETCAQYARRVRKVENASNRLVSHITRKCPKCKTHTEKNGGCNHIVRLC